MISIMRVLFPAPPPSYRSNHPNLIQIPSYDTRTASRVNIPALYRPLKPQKTSLVIAFHPNGEDAGSSLPLFTKLASSLHSSGLLVAEYPHYGVYTRGELSEYQILYDAQAVYDFATDKLGYSHKNIIIIGYSIGTNPATYLASVRENRFLVLIAPFLSAREIARDKVSVLGFLVEDTFNTESYLPNIANPVLVIHGGKDSLIPPWHGEKICGILRQSRKYARFKLLPECDHNNIANSHKLPMIIAQFSHGITRHPRHRG